MPVANIIDHRSNTANINVYAVFEPSWHDNSCPAATQFAQTDDDWTVEELANTTVEQAIAYANAQWMAIPVTVYLYGAETETFSGL